MGRIHTREAAGIKGSGVRVCRGAPRALRYRPVKRLVLFDIDGTILLTGGAGLRAMAKATVELFGERFVWDGMNTSGGLDPLLLAEAAARCGIPLRDGDQEAFRELYVRRLEEELESGATVTVMPGIPELIAGLRRREEVVLGLLTGNYEAGARLKLAAAGLSREWFPVAAFGDEAGSRPELVGVALRRYRERHPEAPRPLSTLIIGDTPHDVNCARRNGCRILAVATGRYAVEELCAAGADLAVRDLANAEPVFRLLGLEP
jgi:phosphoglycolate phosphatase